MNYWEELLAFDKGKLSKDELIHLTESMKAEGGFLKQQADKLDLYLTQLGDGVITEKEFRSFMIDLRDLTELELIRKRVANVALAQKTLEILGKLLIKSAIVAI